MGIRYFRWVAAGVGGALSEESQQGIDRLQRVIVDTPIENGKNLRQQTRTSHSFLPEKAARVSDVLFSVSTSETPATHVCSSGQVRSPGIL
jgi:hypothetical protein